MRLKLITYELQNFVNMQLNIMFWFVKLSCGFDVLIKFDI
jgi:hypothetical protein